MDALGFLGIALGLVAALGTAYGIGRKQVGASLNDKALQPVNAEIGRVDHRVRGLQQWRELLPAQLEAKFVQRGEFSLVIASLERIERNQEALTKRFMDGAVS